MKDYREKELKAYIVGNILILGLLSLKIDIKAFVVGDYYSIVASIFSTGIVSMSFYAYSFIMDSLVPSDWKHKIATLSRLPGETIWTELKKTSRDNRFSTEEVHEKYKYVYDAIPHENSYKYQNQQWYKIYSRVQTEVKVEQAQRDYLLCRDMNVSNVMMIIIYLVFCFGFKFFNFSWSAIIFIGIMYVLLIISTKNRAVRFAKTVISVDINYSKKNSDDKK